MSSPTPGLHSRYLVYCSHLVLLLCFLPMHGHAQDGGFVSFAQERIVVDEGSSLFTPVSIPLLRVGGTTEAVVVSISVSRVHDTLALPAGAPMLA